MCYAEAAEICATVVLLSLVSELDHVGVSVQVKLRESRWSALEPNTGGLPLTLEVFKLVLSLRCNSSNTLVWTVQNVCPDIVSQLVTHLTLRGGETQKC